MDDDIYIPIPPGLEKEEEVDLIEYLERYADALSPAFDLKVDGGDCRTSYVDHQIIDATLTDNGIMVHYEISTHTYHGCKDMDSEDTILRDFFGLSDGIHWVFQSSLSLDPRSTFEEF